MKKQKNVPRAPVELSALVHAENQVHVMARPEGLVENALVMLLRRPQSLGDAQVQVVLERGKWSVRVEERGNLRYAKKGREKAVDVCAR